jgi:hypothetical protein
MTPQHRFHSLSVRVQAGLIVATLVGSTLAFGGAVWWARPMLAAMLGSLAVATVVRSTLEGRFTALRSPLGAIGAMVVLLALVQIAPLPAGLARRLSPRARAAYTLGALPEAARADDPAAELVDVSGMRTPATLDRSATLRWAVGALGCLALFGVAGHFADRLDRSLLVWGAVVGSLFVCTAIAVVQVLGRTEGLYGFLQPGRAPVWAPSTADLLATPNQTVLRELSGNAGSAAILPDRPAAMAGLPGGPGAFLALASLGLPLAMGLILQMIAPGGARGPLSEQLRRTGRGGMAGLLFGLLLLTAALAGSQAGRVLSLPLALGLVLAGVPVMWGTGLRAVAVVATGLALIALVSGIWLGETAGRLPGAPALADASGWPATRAVWGETARIARDFPLIGAGLGSFATIHPYYKAGDASPTTALSSLLQWWAEAGLAGVVLVILAGAWVAWKIPGAVRRVGTADRAMAYGLLGAVAGFATFSAVHWTTELAAVALAASAVSGTCHRWLAGGTDLFVARA